MSHHNTVNIYAAFFSNNFMSYLLSFQGMYFDIIKSSLYCEKWDNEESRQKIVILITMQIFS